MENAETGSEAHGENDQGGMEMKHQSQQSMRMKYFASAGFDYSDDHGLHPILRIFHSPHQKTMRRTMHSLLGKKNALMSMLKCHRGPLHQMMKLMQ